MKAVGIAGGGTMGSGIAEIVARVGDSALILERDQRACDIAVDRIERSLARAVKAGRLGSEDAVQALSRVSTTVNVGDFGDRQLVIEALPENEDLKSDFFGTLERLVPTDAVLATNTSSIPIIRVARGLSDPSRLIGVHFFNPVPVMPLVEIVVSLATKPAAVDEVTAYVRDRLGKHTIRAGDRGGFIVNALLVPYLVSAIRMYEVGFATKEDIDQGMVSGCAYPMGPLTLCDTIGLDVVLDVANSLFHEFHEQHLAPPPLLKRMVEAGYLGKKSGRGFYCYSP